ncbi:MAG: hypothetical protein KGO02_19180, partial [Alphaproteobacteria bacterium]|nr:hypothetical protein [Alphaproteobacteria bacterium]
MAFGLLMTVVGLGALCALLYNCAVYALPVLVGLWVGFGVLHLGGGPLAAFATGCISAGRAFGLCQAIFERARSNALRWVAVIVFVVPAVLVG